MSRQSYSGDEAMDSATSANSGHNFLPGRKFEHRNMYEVEGPGLLPKTNSGRSVHRWTSANTPDSLDRTGAEPYSQQFDVKGTRKHRSKSSDRTYQNFPPGYNVNQPLAGRRRSAELAVKLNLHTREFPSRKEPTDIKAGNCESEDGHRDEKEKAHKVRKERRVKAKRDNDEKAEQKTDISIILENRETRTSGLYARGQAAPAVVNKKLKEGRRQQKRLDNVTDAEETKENDMAAKVVEAPLELRQTKYSNYVIDELIANLENRRKQIQAYKSKADTFVSHFNEDGSLLTSQDNTFAENRNDIVLPPINGSSMAIKKRKSKKFEYIGKQTSEEGQRYFDDVQTTNDKYQFKLPSINKKSTVNLTSQEVVGRDVMDVDPLINRRDASHFPDAENCMSPIVLPPVYVTGTSMGNTKNHDILEGSVDHQNNYNSSVQGKYSRCLKKIVLPPLTDAANRKSPRFVARGASLPLNHAYAVEPTLPVVHNMVLPSVTGLPAPTTKDKRKSKGRYEV